MAPIIEIKNISKSYKISGKKQGYIALRDVLAYNLRRPFTWFKKTAKTITGGNRSEIFWALKDINFSVEKGEIIGIIGPNGAGKSTLLKILSQITPPTNGEIILRGKVASLLEVGTGFHPELTGRENIFLNGAILGMTRKEIASKFDQIVEFSGIGQFLDTPVKRYSSGMYVRLAFSVAAHMEPDILFIDEVLAVGDAEFQKKCLGKMDEVTKTEGRTILFVSHNMDAVNRLCAKTILLDHGRIIASGNTSEVIGKYLSGGYENSSSLTFPITDRDVTIHKYSVTQDGKPAPEMAGERPIDIAVEFSVNQSLHSFRAGIFIKNSMGAVIARTFVQDYAPAMEEIQPGRYNAQLTIPERLLMAGQYHIELKVFCFGTTGFFEREHIEQSITIYTPKDYNEVRSKNTDTRGYFLIPNMWNIKKN